MAADSQQLLKAVDFAAIKHKDQRRKNPGKTPYINHPIGVANILSNEADVTDIEVLVTAILHDTVEDTETSCEEIEEHFGRCIRILVEECSDDKSLQKAERKRQQIEHAPMCSPKAKLVKLADKIYNLRDLNEITPEGWSEERVQEYFSWASKVFVGLRGTNKNLDRIYEELLKNRGVEISPLDI